MKDSLFDSDSDSEPPEDEQPGEPDVTLGTCPRCGCPSARIRPRPDTGHHAELRCPKCHEFRWLPKPKPRTKAEGHDPMATATQHQPIQANPDPNARPSPWDMKVGGGGNGNGDYVCCPPGNYPATIVGIFDVGHQDENTQSGPKQLRRLVLIFELAKRRPDGKPFVLCKRYTWSMNEKANLYKDVVNITGAKFKEGDHFNPLSLNGIPVMVNVTNTQSGEKTYHDVGGVAQYPEGFPAIDSTHHPIAWTVMTGEAFPGNLEWLPFVYGKSIRELAEVSRERRSPGNAPLNPPPSTGGEDIPF